MQRHILAVSMRVDLVILQTTLSHADRSLVSMHIAYFKNETHNMSLTENSTNMFLKFRQT